MEYKELTNYLEFIMQITENIHLVPDVVANPYLIVDPDGVTLIDAGMPRSEKKILAALAELGKSPTDLERILLTHSDIDHVGSLAALQRASGARTYTSRIEAEAIAAGKPSRAIQPRGFSLRRVMFTLLRLFIKPTPFEVDEIISDGQVLPIAGGLRVVETPGHTPGHISLYAESAGVLFCGDSMVSNESGLQGSRPGVTWDAAQAQESVRKQAALGARIVCPGHGPVVTGAEGKFPK